MARAHGRTATSIWSDPDFIGMSEGAQRLYLFLCSQSDLTHAGLVPLRLRRWATKTPGVTPKGIRERLAELEQLRFVVVDEDTEEVLIRTFVRNDGVYKQPKVMLRMREDARQIESRTLRAAFRAELDRLPLDELPDTPGGKFGDQPSTRGVVAAVVDALRDDFNYPPEGVADTLPDTLPDTPHVRAGALPQPPTPNPLPPDNPSSSKLDDLAADFDAFWALYPRKQGKGQARTAFKGARKKTDQATITHGVEQYVKALSRDAVGAKFVAMPATWLNGERWADERPLKASPTETGGAWWLK